MIGIFDSGIGGLIVAKRILKELPSYRIIYFGDNAHLPYGTKSPNLIKKWSKDIVKFLLKKGAKIIIIACHTASAVAFNFLKKEFPHLPIFEMITPGIKKSSQITKNKRIGIIGTPITIKSQIHKKKLLSLDSQLKIYSKACPLLVPLVEEGLIKNKITQEILKTYLLPLKQKKIDTLILACTHYPLLKDNISKILGREIKIIDPTDDLIKFLKEKIKKENSLFIPKEKKSAKQYFYFSDEPYNFKFISKFFLSEINREFELKVIKLDKD
jgi:glutamate racemase